MNAKLKFKFNEQMTVNSLSHNNSPILSTDRFCNNSSKPVFNSKSDRLSIGLNQLKIQKNVSPVERRSVHSTDRTDPSSSIILRQKLLHRNKNGAIVGPSHTSKGRKSYSRSQNNGFKFHNFVVNEDKRSCLEEQDGTKKITVSHWKRPNTSQIIVNEDSHESLSTTSPPSHSILETLLAPNSSNTQTTEDPQRVSKRKPLHVRRVLRQQDNQVMDLTKLEPQDEPLDLSFKRNEFNVGSVESKSIHLNSRLFLNNRRNEFFNSESPTESESVQHLIKSVNRSAAQASAIISSVKCPNSANFSSNSPKDSSIAQKQLSVNCGVSSKQQKLRQTHRSLIKKQLEETFKQNGFLVKVFVDFFH